jgi:glycosyltransferase involved in cell wall biosynthesis
MTDRLISIILPVYNQADHISGVVEEYQQILSKMQNPYEMLLVVNGSRDNSLDVCQSLAQKYPSIKVFHTEKGGWGLAVKLGISKAEGSVVCYTNSARTSAEDLLLLLLYAVVNVDTVIKANRKIRDNWRRRLGSLLYNLECRALFDLSYWDINGTPKVFPRKYSKLLDLKENGDLIDAEFNVICRRENYRMLEVPIFSASRRGGTSTTKYMSALKMYWGVYQLWKSMRSNGT